MTDYTRGEFLGVGGAFLLGAAGGGGTESRADASTAPARRSDQQAVPGAAPDLIVVNGRVYTMDDGQPRAEAFAVKHGRFLAVGTSDDVSGMAGPDTEVIDAAEMTVTPGFIDAHCHPGGVNELLDVDLGQVETIADIQRLIRARAQETPLGRWIDAFKYDDTKVVDPDGGAYRRIHRWDLDEAATDHPVRVSHRGGHIAWYNSRALEMAGVTAEIEDPPGGRFERDSDGELTGLVEEEAQEVFSGVGEAPEITRENRRDGIAHLSGLMTAAGLTSVHWTGGSRNDLVALQDAYQAGTMRYRMYFFPSGYGDAYGALKDAGVRTGLGDEWLRIGAVKYTADGSASGRTMAMSTPFVGRPDDYGILTMEQDEIHEVVEEAHRAGWQVGIHANGDVAIDMVLNAYEQIQEEFPRPDPRHRIEHCTLVNESLLRRIRAVGAIPTPFYTYVHYHGNKWLEYGEDKLTRMFAHRSFLDHGIPVAPASDYVPGPFEPLMAIQSMVTRTDMRGRVWGPNQRITVGEALRICTRNGAYASFEEDLKGSITPGKLADFVILAEDPHDADPERIKEIQVVRTVVGGRTMHEA